MDAPATYGGRSPPLALEMLDGAPTAACASMSIILPSASASTHQPGEGERERDNPQHPALVLAHIILLSIVHDTTWPSCDEMVGS